MKSTPLTDMRHLANEMRRMSNITKQILQHDMDSIAGEAETGHLDNIFVYVVFTVLAFVALAWASHAW